MKRKSYLTLGALGLVTVLAALIVSACGQSKQEIAVLDWQKLLALHPGYPRLQLGEAVLQDLEKKRGLHKWQGRVQFSALGKLHELRAASERNFLAADLDTRKLELENSKQEQLQKILEQLEAKVEAEVAAQRSQLENEYQLCLFNLRLQTENAKPTFGQDAKLTPEERRQREFAQRQLMEQEIKRLKQERDRKIFYLEQQKEASINALFQPYSAEAQKRLLAKVEELQQSIRERLQQSSLSKEGQKNDNSEALNEASLVLDREIIKQQQQNQKARREIDADIEQAVATIARTKGISVVFREVKANASALDLTAAVSNAIQANHKEGK